MSNADQRPSADSIRDPEGRQYHIGLKAGEVAHWVVLVGDPERAARVALRMDSVRVEVRRREFVTYTGQLAGRELTVLGTGIGCDNVEIAVVELLECRRDLTLLRVGSCAALQPEIGLGELVISTGALRLESTSLGFVSEGYPALAHHEVVLALTSAARRLGAPYHQGVTACAAGFYGWQGRKDQAIAPRFPELCAELARSRVQNFEMESSTLFTLATLAGVRAGTVCAVYANRALDSFIDWTEKERAEARAIDVGLETIEFLAWMDARGRPFHLERPLDI